MKKRIIAIIIAAAMLFSLTSCVRTRSRVKFNSDGTVETTYLIAVSTQAAESSGEDAASSFMDEQTLAMYEKNGCTISEYNEDGYYGYLITQKVDPAKQAETDSEETEELTGMIYSESSWLVEDGVAYFEYDSNSLAESETMRESADIIKALGGFAYVTLEFPIKPLASNATEVSEDGKILTWDILETSLVHVEYDFEELKKSGVTFTKYATNPFEDVKHDDACHDPVLWAYNYGITTGTSETKFSPEASCTRGQVVTFLWRSVGEPEPMTTDNPFTDVKESDYFYKAVLWAVENEITTGTSATKFSPDTTCSYAHILTFIWRAFGEPGKTGEGEWYADAMSWAEKTAMLNGFFTNDSDPMAECPRGAVVTFLYRSVGSIIGYITYDTYDDYGEWDEFVIEPQDAESEDTAE